MNFLPSRSSGRKRLTETSKNISQILRLFGRRDFALFAAADGISGLGSSMAPIALTFGLLKEGYSLTFIGVVFGSQIVPNLMALMIGGMLGDLFSRKSVLILADVTSGLAQICMGICITSHDHGYLIPLFAATLGIAESISGPVLFGMVPFVAGKEFVIQANSLFVTIFSCVSVIGPLLSGVLVGSFGARTVIDLDAASYIVSAVLLQSISTTQSSVEPGLGLRGDFVAGLKQFFKFRWLLALALHNGALNFLALSPFALIMPELFSHVHQGVQLWGRLSAAVGVGSVLASCLIIAWKPRMRFVVLQGATFVIGFNLVVFSESTSIQLSTLFGVLFGFARIIYGVLVDTLLQERVDSGFLSRVNSVFGLIATGLSPLSYLLVGILSTHMKSRAELELGGVLLLLVTPLIIVREIALEAGVGAAKSS